MRSFSLAVFLIFVFSRNSYAQEVATHNLADSVQVNSLLDGAKKFRTEDKDKSLALSQEALELARKIGYQKGEAFAYKEIGIAYYHDGKRVQTLEAWNTSLSILRDMHDDNGVANLLSNIGALYASQGDDAKALEYHLKSLQLSEKTGNKLRILTSLNNIGSVYFEKQQTWNKALDYLLRGLPLAEELGDKTSIGVLSANIGEIYSGKGDIAKATFYYNKSLKQGNSADQAFAFNGLGKLALKQGKTNDALSYHTRALNMAKLSNENHIAPSLQGIANVYIARKDYHTALNYFKNAEITADSLEMYPTLKELYEQMADAYSAAGDFSTAFQYQKNLNRIKDTLFNEITQKKVGSLQFEFDMQKKEGEINLLTKDKALKDVELRRQTVVRNAMGGGLVLVFFIAFIIYRNYRSKVRTNRILDHQKHQIEDLLLNILPEEVAQELKVNGSATPRSYHNVSVLFTDFKGFTAIADKISPEELVQELNACFMAFDDIIIANNLEKIKTIGDSYMCAGGIPTEDESHIFNIIKAGLDIQAYIKANNDRRREEGREVWDIRIGIHTGPLVAGVVGKKKYAYDIWGSTVNIASRMESNGVPGQINISAAVYEKIKHLYACTYRGKIYAKNVGEVDMYLIGGDGTQFEEQETKAKAEIKEGPILMG